VSPCLRRVVSEYRAVISELGDEDTPFANLLSYGEGSRALPCDVIGTHRAQLFVAYDDDVIVIIELFVFSCLLPQQCTVLHGCVLMLFCVRAFQLCSNER
jgi:hypothetical protein